MMMGLVVLPMLAFTFVAAFVAEGLQTGFRFTPKALEPKLSKMNPISGVKRISWDQRAKNLFNRFFEILFHRNCGLVNFSNI